MTAGGERSGDVTISSIVVCSKFALGTKTVAREAPVIVRMATIVASGPTGAFTDETETMAW